MARLAGAGHCFLGAWRTQREAAEAYDRAVLYYRGLHERQNFPRKRLVPADVHALQDEARRRAKQLTSSSFRGVAWDAPSWIAQIKVRGRHIGLGNWPTEVTAAMAYDRAVGFYRLNRRTLNFPGRRLSSQAPSELRRAARLVRKAERHTSRYRGVFLVAHETSRPWIAQLTLLGRPTITLGTWASENDAARAYDRAARHYGLPTAALNFPREKLTAAAPPVLVGEARREGKRARTSRYLGVSWSSPSERWLAQITHRSQNIYLGLFVDERRAAEAYDAKAIALRGPRAQINFHPDTGEFILGQRLEDLASASRGRGQDRGLKKDQPTAR
jgi:hypothetical protein